MEYRVFLHSVSDISAASRLLQTESKKKIHGKYLSGSTCLHPTTQSHPNGSLSVPKKSSVKSLY